MRRIISSPFAVRKAAVSFTRWTSTFSTPGASALSKFKLPLHAPRCILTRSFASEGDVIGPIESKITAVEHEIMKVEAAINALEIEINMEKQRDPRDKESLDRLHKKEEQLRKEKEQLRKEKELLLKASLPTMSSASEYFLFL